MDSQHNKRKTQLKTRRKETTRFFTAGSKPRQQKIIVIVGPTASGKSAFAVRLALRLSSGQAKKKFGICGAEIISADSRQVYRGLNIGTAKITKKEMRGIKHYCLDIANPKKPFTADDFRKAADKAIGQIRAKEKIPIMVGGTGFYIDTVLYRALGPDVPPDWKLRKKLEKKSAETLFGRLKKLDPRRASTIDPHNKRRLIRALEIAKALGKVPKLVRKPRYEAIFIGLNPPTEELKKHISRRVDTMLRKGLLKETKSLIKQKIPRRRFAELGFEYRYPLLYLEGKISRDEMRQRIKTETWHYAKRQMTWFNKLNKK